MKATNHDLKTIHADDLHEVLESVLEDDPELHDVVLEIRGDRQRKRNQTRQLHQPSQN